MIGVLRQEPRDSVVCAEAIVVGYLRHRRRSAIVVVDQQRRVVVH